MKLNVVTIKGNKMVKLDEILFCNQTFFCCIGNKFINISSHIVGEFLLDYKTIYFYGNCVYLKEVDISSGHPVSTIIQERTRRFARTCWKPTSKITHVNRYRVLTQKIIARARR